MLKTLLITTAVSGVIISGAIAQSETPTAPPAKDQSAAPKDQRKTNQRRRKNRPLRRKLNSLPHKAQTSGCLQSSEEATCSVQTMHVSCSVNDLLFDATGKIIGMVVGVGRFLGIGTKSVAIDVSAFNLSRSIPAVTTTTLLQATRTTRATSS